MVSQMLVAMNKEIPEPKPKPATTKAKFGTNGSDPTHHHPHHGQTAHRTVTIQRPWPRTLLHELIEQHDNDSGGEQLQDDEDGVAGTQVLHVSVHARQDVRDGLADGDEDTEHCVNAHTECKDHAAHMCTHAFERPGRECGPPSGSGQR